MRGSFFKNYQEFQDGDSRALNPELGSSKYEALGDCTGLIPISSALHFRPQYQIQGMAHSFISPKQNLASKKLGCSIPQSWEPTRNVGLCGATQWQVWEGRPCPWAPMVSLFTVAPLAM